MRPRLSSKSGGFARAFALVALTALPGCGRVMDIGMPSASMSDLRSVPRWCIEGSDLVVEIPPPVKHSSYKVRVNATKEGHSVVLEGRLTADLDLPERRVFDLGGVGFVGKTRSPDRVMWREADGTLVTLPESDRPL